MGYFLEIIVRILVFGGLWYLFNKNKFEEEKKLRLNTVKVTIIFVVVSIAVEQLLAALG